MMLQQRAAEPELLDNPNADVREVIRSLRFCAKVNRFLGGTRVVRRFLEAEFRRAPAGQNLRVLDIGSGDGGIPLAVNRWVKRQGRNVEWTCLERSAHAARLARQAVVAAHDSQIRVVEEDVFDHKPEEPYDYAIGSMFFHHLSDEEILALLEQLGTYVRGSVLINDLKRCGVCYRGFAAMAWLFSPTVRHDALLSIRRGFRPGKLRRLLARAEGAISVSVTRHRFCRLAGVVRFPVSKARMEL
jgi:SAM-dependent methyltransferase